MKFFTTIGVCLVLVIGVTLGEAATVTLSMRNSDGLDLGSEADELFGTIITFTCEFPELSLATEYGLYKVHLELQIDGTWRDQGFCQYDSNNFPTGKVYLTDHNFLNLAESDLSCEESAEYRVSLPLSTHTSYSCNFENSWTIDENYSEPVMLKSHSEPKKPVLTPNPIELREGESLSITCESEAYPAPGLEIKLDGTIKAESAATHTEKSYATEGSELLQTNTVTWNLQSASRDDNGDELVCQVVDDHPYNQTVATLTTMHVIFGPDTDQGATENIEYNKNSGEPLLLEVHMDAYPALEYTWYYGDDIRGDGAICQVATSDIVNENIQKYPHNLVYRVVGENSRNGKDAEKTFNITVKDDVANCPSSYVRNPHTNTCYGIVEDKTDWSDAQSHCNSSEHPGHLATFETLESASWFIHQRKNRKDWGERAWIGGRKDSSSDYRKWEWYGRYERVKSEVSYSVWQNGEPNNKDDSDEWCMESGNKDENFLFNDENCDDELFFFCEIVV